MKSILLDRSSLDVSLIFLFLIFTNLVNGQMKNANDSLSQEQGANVGMWSSDNGEDLDSNDLATIKRSSYTYLGQALDGRISGINTIRPSSEPGVGATMMMRGISFPIGDYEDLYANRPLVVVDGIPLLRNDHPYQLKIKEFSFTGIGSDIDINALIDYNNIEKVKVIKGPEAVATYGPKATNGAILITTRPPEAGSFSIGMNIYGGVSIATEANSGSAAEFINGNYQRDLLGAFYDKYTSPHNTTSFPPYLTDSTSRNYFGPANWNDAYYHVALQHGAGVNISGGSEKAKFRFGVGEHTEEGVADQTALKRYNVYYDMMIQSGEKLNFRFYAQAAMADKDRNNSFRERFGEIEYFPNQSFPISPNKEVVSEYYNKLEQGIDRNQVNSIQVLANVRYDVFNNLNINSDFSIDYNDNHRDLFVPGALNDGNSYNSYYAGVNRRILWNNYLDYKLSFSNKSRLKLNIGQSLEFNKQQYDYIKGYRGPSDFIKIIQVDGNDWITHNKNLVYAYKDYLKENLVAFYGNAHYLLKDKYALAVSLRSDGSSYFGNGYLWGVSPIVRLGWNIKKETWLQNSQLIKDASIDLSVGKTDRLPVNDYYGYGPYYTADIGWEGSGKVSTYASYPTLGLPFSDGYVGGTLRRSHTNHVDLNINVQTAHYFSLSARIYNKVDQGLLLPVSTTVNTYGFSGEWMNGMDIRNRGVELNLTRTIHFIQDFKWNSRLIFQYNENELLRLPNDVVGTDYGQRRLNVGKSVDQFWLFQNEGIYENKADIPETNGRVLSLNGIPFDIGDPKWTDVNKDGKIDDQDRLMVGHVIAPFHGGWNNTIDYKNWTLDFSFLYSFGKHILNGAVANRMDFANRDGSNDITGVKELTYWRVRNDLNKYPIYNPWSTVNPYQPEQTLFYEKGGFLRLQSLQLQYDLTPTQWIQNSGVKRLEIYISAMNLFTLTPYKGGDPSLVDPFGYDYDYTEPLPMTITFGIHVNF